tara:strand:+ start:58 stop:1041 length:984 start_codon:yes stop_codon:yes gene_type:complete
MIKTHQNSGVTLIEMLIGIVVSSILIAAMYTTYSVINNTYSRVTDVAGISKSGRDIVSMIMRDVRMAGFKYYYGYNAENEARPLNIKIPKTDYLEFVAGDTAATERDSHAPVVIYRNTIGDATKVTAEEPIAPGYEILDTAEKINNVCCDQIHIVFGDFDANADIGAGEQYYKKYKISYFARALRKDGDEFYGVFRSKKYWRQPLDEDTGSWVVDNCPGSDCYSGELVREYLTDMSFVAMDKFGRVVEANPKDPDKIYDIRSVDMTLTFRSATKAGFFKNLKQGTSRQILSLGREAEQFTGEDAAYKRDSIFLTVHTRNLGGIGMAN